MAEPTGPGTSARATDGGSAGFVFAILAAASAGLLLFIPITLAGYSLYLLAALISGEPLPHGDLAMTFTFLGIIGLISIVLLVIPYLLFGVARRRMGTREAVLVAVGLLAAWHLAVAIFWAWGSTIGFSHAPVGDVLWYPFAFGIVAVIATLLIDRRLAIAPVAVLLVLGLLLSGTVRGHTAVPVGAQQVKVEVTTTGVRLSPASVHAGDVYVVLVTRRSSISFTQDELVGTDVPANREFDLAGCTDAQRAADRGQQGYCGNVFKVNLTAGKYVFISTSPGGAAEAQARLEVVP